MNKFLSAFLIKLNTIFFFQIINLRTLYWRLLFNNSTLQVFGKIAIYHPNNITLGDHVNLNHQVFINARSPIKIGNKVTISQQVIITTTGLTTTKNRKHIQKPIVLGNNVWVGAGAIILPGVTIADNSTIAAGAVVTKSVTKNTIVAGVPAKPIKKVN